MQLAERNEQPRTHREAQKRRFGHKGHEGARDGRGHFRVMIVSDAFAGMNAIARHRAVYAAMGELMTTDIHALSIEAVASSEL